MMGNKQLKIGAVLSYILIVVNSIYGMFITPYILGILGASEYGIYKTIASFAGSLMILDLGIGSTVLRYVAKFNAEKDLKKIENFSAMCMIQAAAISLVIASISVVLYNLIDSVYSSSLTDIEISKAKQLFVILIINICFHICENVVHGIIAGCNRFAFANAVGVSRILLRIILVCFILAAYSDSLVLVGIDLLVTILTIFVEIIYIKKGLLIRIKFYYWDKALFIESMKYTFQLFIQTIVYQINGNLGNIVIGAVIGAGAVAVYSIGQQIFDMFQQFAVSLSGLMLPTVTNQIQAGASSYELENTVIKIGRLQFTLLGAVLAGFAIVGKEFINLWLGDAFKDAWIIAMILIVPSSVELVQNVCLSILRARNKLTSRTIAVSCMAVFNLIITIIGVRKFGYIIAAVGTSLGLIGSHLIAMNIYYYKVLKINVIRIFKEVYRRTIICLLAASFCLYVVNTLLYGSWIALLLKIVVFCIIYGASMIIYGFNDYEKYHLAGFIFKKKQTKATQ